MTNDRGNTRSNVKRGTNDSASGGSKNAAQTGTSTGKAHLKAVDGGAGKNTGSSRGAGSTSGAGGTSKAPARTAAVAPQQPSKLSIEDLLHASEETLTRMLRASKVLGGIYTHDYDRAIVVTDDFRKQEVGGVPRTGFLLAATTEGTGTELTLAEPEVVLLRVRGAAALPNEADLTTLRMSVVKSAYTTGAEYEDMQDAFTMASLQQSALDCEVLGTFYADERTGNIAFGPDVDNVYSAARYRVFVPGPKVLSWIASYPRISDDGSDLSIPIGSVRYSATRRKSQAAQLADSPVNVHVSDFVARKTALLGMSRTGKSNSIKTICTAVYRYAAEAGVNVGQLIFDPQGEYANVNQQDGTGLRLLGDEDSVRVYKVNPDPNQPQEKPLRLDFYDVDMLDVAWGLVSDFLSDESAAYIERLRATDLTNPDRGDYPAGKAGDAEFASAERAIARGRLAFYGLLYKCGFAGRTFNGSAAPAGANGQPQQPMLTVQLKDATAQKILNEHPSSLHQVRPGTWAVTTPKGAKEVAMWISLNLEIDGDLSSWSECEPFIAIREVLRRGAGIALARLASLRDFHDNTAKQEVNEAVWDDMVNGRLAIVDLSVGQPEVTARIAERIVNHLLDRASERFRKDMSPVALQVVVEEAHNLFERSESEATKNPWVRLSKEAAKYGMGLVYATQEVTSVDRRILSNTANWVISHLNSSQETAELARYYDFEVFAEGLRKVDEKGFVRLKTYSGRYIVPVQIAKFDHKMINAARNAAGLKSVRSDGSLVEVGDADYAEYVDADVAGF